MYLASLSYRVADAMLAVRRQPKKAMDAAFRKSFQTHQPDCSCEWCELLGNNIRFDPKYRRANKKPLSLSVDEKATPFVLVVLRVIRDAPDGMPSTDLVAPLRLRGPRGVGPVMRMASDVLANSNIPFDQIICRTFNRIATGAIVTWWKAGPLIDKAIEILQAGKQPQPAPEET